VDPARHFFIFLARNLLKSLDSEKEMKANKSNFPFICFRLLAFACAFRPVRFAAEMRLASAGRRPDMRFAAPP
jgi:hypothetical protein